MIRPDTRSVSALHVGFRPHNWSESTQKIGDFVRRNIGHDPHFCPRFVRIRIIDLKAYAWVLSPTDLTAYSVIKRLCACPYNSVWALLAYMIIPHTTWVVLPKDIVTRLLNKIAYLLQRYYYYLNKHSNVNYLHMDNLSHVPNWNGYANEQKYLSECSSMVNEGDPEFAYKERIDLKTRQLNRIRIQLQKHK
jgi:hypothetical protein